MINQDENGIWWPKEDRHCRHVSPRDLGLLPNYVRCSGLRRIAIQAGGYVGLFAQFLSQFFDMVHTFEPEPACVMAMKKNIKSSRVRIHEAALWSEPTTVDLYRIPKRKDNYGATRVRPSDVSSVPGPGTVKAVAIDDFNFGPVDLIMLDIEGSEYQALLGAKKTIQAYHPAITVELKGIGGDDEDAARHFLTALGYEKIRMIGKDEVWKYQS